MTVPQSVATILKEHVTLEVEGIDRMYLNVYVPKLQRELGVVAFFRYHRGAIFASSALMDPISRAFVSGMERFAKEQEVRLFTFARGQRKDDVAAEHRARCTKDEGVLFIGKAQEKATVFRTEKRQHPQTRKTYPWIVRSTAMVNQYYVYAMDADFGPFFLTFCSYFPYNAKLCLNGHEYVKRQLTREGIAFEALDNGIRSCADPTRLQAICDGLSDELIEALLRKWLARLPHPFSPDDANAGYTYALSILQLECFLTQVLDRPLTGRIFFEEVIREHLDIGRPDQVQLIFGRRVTKRTPGRFRTCIITEGVVPSLHIDYKSSRIKQYHKEGRALRTETTMNDPRDFALGKGLQNLPALRHVGFHANRRLLDVQRSSDDCAIGEDGFQRVTRPIVVNGQRAPALPFADPRVQALLNVLVLFCLLPRGFAHRDVRDHLAPLLGLAPDQLTPGNVTYDLRRLRLHGLIERLPHSHRYRLTPEGLHTALFFTRTYARILPIIPSDDRILRPAFDRLDTAIDQWADQAKLSA